MSHIRVRFVIQTIAKMQLHTRGRKKKVPQTAQDALTPLQCCCHVWSVSQAEPKQRPMSVRMVLSLPFVSSYLPCKNAVLLLRSDINKELGRVEPVGAGGEREHTVITGIRKY